VAEEDLVAEVTAAGAAAFVAVVFTVAAFEQHRLFVAVVHTLPGELLADQASHHVFTMVAVQFPV
jgi:hypothetical protein